ncbi:MAG: DJ-1/PfpI family protein [Oscillospiraceae bacterium]|nr:DJ-1/PfpI family protein [Oscillospiraceae bacterium]
MVYMLLGEGFEEIEAVAPLDILRRADIEAATVSITADAMVCGGHGLTVKADMTLEQVDFESLEMLVLPGGGGGVASIAGSTGAMELIRRVLDSGKMIGAICAAPSLLAKLGIIDGRKVTCYPTVSDKVEAAGGIVQRGVPVVADGNFITGQAAGSAIEFGLALVTKLRCRDASEEVRQEIIC